MDLKTIAIINPDGTVVTKPYDGSAAAVVAILDEVFGADCEADVIPLLTLYQGLAVKAYGDDEALLNGRAPNFVASQLRSSKDPSWQPIFGPVVIVPDTADA